MGVRVLGDLVAFQLSLRFKQEVYRLVRAHPSAERDLRYRNQLFDAALSVSANIAEGFGRRTAKDFRLFLSYARGSIAEAMTRLEDGVDRGHFTADSCADALQLARRTAAAVAGLQRHLNASLGDHTSA